MTSTNQSRELKLIEVAVPDNGKEVLWADAVGQALRIVSVPVFAYGVSHGTLVSVDASGDRLKLDRVLRASPGATIRCYAVKTLQAHDVYYHSILPDTAKNRLSLGPATLFDPEVVAIHDLKRSELGSISNYLDSLVRQMILRFWEVSDPTPELSEGEDKSDEPWELVHPLPAGGGPAVASVH
jgi:hypothetical protein